MPALQLSLRMPPHPVGWQPTALQVHPAMPLHPVGCQPTSLQVRLNHASFSRAALQLSLRMSPHPVGCQPTALQVHPAMPLHPVGCQPTSLQVRLNHASFSRAALQLSLRMSPHPVGCQPTALQVHPAMPLHPVGCQPTSLQVRLNHASFSRTSLSYKTLVAEFGSILYHTMPDWTPCRREFHPENSCEFHELRTFGISVGDPSQPKKYECILVAMRFSFVGDSSCKPSRATLIGKTSKMHKYISGWWFQIFFIFIPIWGRFPSWPIFFR